MNNLRKEARELSEALHHSLQQNVPPIDLNPLISWIESQLGINVKVLTSRSSLAKKGMSGLISRNDSNAIILLNQKEPMVRRRFTLAHEFGHLLEAIQEGYMSQTKPEGYDGERFANSFAAEFLMPVNLVVHEWHKLRTTFNATITQYKLAQLFDVSNEAMGYRLSELKLQSHHWNGTHIPPVYR